MSALCVKAVWAGIALLAKCNEVAWCWSYQVNFFGDVDIVLTIEAVLEDLSLAYCVFPFRLARLMFVTGASTVSSLLFQSLNPQRRTEVLWSVFNYLVGTALYHSVSGVIAVEDEKSLSVLVNSSSVVSPVAAILQVLHSVVRCGAGSKTVCYILILALLFTSG